MSRQTLKEYISTTLPAMEIGPREKPFLSKEDYNVFYSDIRTAEGVADLYKNQSNVIKSDIVEIDYVIEKTYLDSVGEKRFDTIFSSHVIEHTTDIIKHLEEISQILNEGGNYVLCIPDRRCTFDYFREVTPFRDAYDVYLNGEKSLRRLAFDYSLNSYSGEVMVYDYINNTVTFKEIATNEKRVDEAFDDMKNMNERVGGFHYWCFTGSSFLCFFRDCLRFNLLPFTLEYFKDTVLGDVEFHVVLKKCKDIQTDINLRNSEIVKLNDIIESPKYKNNLKDFINKYRTVYVYGSEKGARYIIEKSKEYADKICGLIISDEIEKINFELPVYHLSEVEFTSDAGIILAMSEPNRIKVKENLLKIGFSNIMEDVFID